MNYSLNIGKKIIPFTYRLFVKDKNAGETKVEDVIMILNCNSSTESITSTFLNGKPGTITYKISGNYYSNVESINPDETIDGVANNATSTTKDGMNNTADSPIDQKIEDITPSSSPSETSSNLIDSSNNLLNIISKYGEFEYDSIENVSIIKINVSSLSDIPEYEAIFSTLENQQSYYNLQGFTCSATKLE